MPSWGSATMSEMVRHRESAELSPEGPGPAGRTVMWCRPNWIQVQAAENALFPFLKDAVDAGQVLDSQKASVKSRHSAQTVVVTLLRFVRILLNIS